MNDLPDKAKKLLLLALNKAAEEGEWKTAAVKAVHEMRKSGYILDTPKPKRFSTQQTRSWTDSERSNHQWRMPFGKYRGVLIAEIPLSYLEWLISARVVDGFLFELVCEEIQKRNND